MRSVVKVDGLYVVAHKGFDYRKTRRAAQCVSKRKDMALLHLTARKQLEEVRTKRLGSLEILQSTLLQVESAAQDVEVCHIPLTNPTQSHLSRTTFF